MATKRTASKHAFPSARRALSHALVLALFFLHAVTLQAEQSITRTHGFALYGDLKYPSDFAHFDFVNPQAPKGGTLRLMGFGSFDTLNPYTLKGTSPINTPGQFMYGFSELNETLLVGTGSYAVPGDEPQSAYGLIAEWLEYPQDMRWVRFKIRDQAHFHDGHAMDAEDVVFSFNTLIKQGHPRFQQKWLNVESLVAESDRIVLATFKQTNQAANILRIGELPVLPQHFWENRNFDASSETKPLLSGPYEVSKVVHGKSLTFTRKDDFWAKDLNIYIGRFNFDTVRIDYYRDQSVAFEAFKSGEFDMFYDYTAKNWAQAYDFPALKEGKVIKEEIAHEIPSGTQGFFFNTRRALFQDKRVRQAISLMFDFEWTNKNLFNDAYQRSQSIYPNSPFSATGLPTQEELRLLSPHKAVLPKELFSEAFALHKTAGNGNVRSAQRQALDLLKQAGWELQDHQLVNQATGQAFEFEILLRQSGLQRVLLPFIKNLERLGIKAEIRLLDTAQYKARLDQFDYDMMTFVLSQGQAPSFEQRDYFHSDQIDVTGSQNYAGVNNPVVDAILDHVLNAGSREELVTAMRALDRVLLWHHYIVPNWHLSYHRIAYWDQFNRPEQTPYVLGVENWWLKNAP